MLTTFELGLLIEYCDKCAEKHKYPTKKEKVRGDCIICGRIGWNNQTQQSLIVDFEGFNDTAWQGGNFTVDQLISFPVGQNRETIHPTLTSKILTEKCILFYDKDIVVIANSQTGQQIRIKF